MQMQATHYITNNDALLDKTRVEWGFASIKVLKWDWRNHFLFLFYHVFQNNALGLICKEMIKFTLLHVVCWVGLIPLLSSILVDAKKWPKAELLLVHWLRLKDLPKRPHVRVNILSVSPTYSISNYLNVCLSTQQQEYVLTVASADSFQNSQVLSL